MRSTWRRQFTILLLLCSPFVAMGENQEFRATWVITWEHSSAGYSPQEGKARIRQILENHSRANMNAVLWQARQSGTAYYNSSYEPWGYYIGGEDPGYDPLEYAIREAHKRGMEVHAWFNVFATASNASGSPAAEHPEWICRDGNGVSMAEAGINPALSPGLEEVRDYTLQVAMEIVRNYDIDGLHLDYVRWNEYTNNGYAGTLAKGPSATGPFDGRISPEALQQLQQASQSDRFLYDVEHPRSGGIPAGFVSWEEWWRHSVTTFVKSLHDSIQAEKPWVRLSTAALGNYNWGGWNGYYTVFQDAALWFNQGYIDQLTPMHYHWDSGSGFYQMLTGTDEESWEKHIQPGIEAGRLFTVGPGSYKLAQENFTKWGRHPGIVQWCRDVEWTDGFQFFSYGSWEDYDYWEEAGSSFFGKEAKIRGTGLISDTIPPAPAVTLQQVDSLQYHLSIRPDTQREDMQWFAIYRSENSHLDPAADTIRDIIFGDAEFMISEKFTGLQDFNREYTYYATMLDRYWNESGLSNPVTTDPIPSFAPQVLRTAPAAGDTVPLISNFSVRFTKRMARQSAAEAIAFSPAVGTGQLEWSERDSRLEIRLSEKIRPDTEYTLTISDALTDVNGKPLDGDADGTAGGAYRLTFYTEPPDTVGPAVVAGYPPPGSTDMAVDPDDILSITFNEKIDPSSMSSNLLELRRQEQVLDFGFHVTDLSDRSILSVQPLSMFQSGGDYTLILHPGLTDSVGNTMTGEWMVEFSTAAWSYEDLMIIDGSITAANWMDPEWSGSTTGTIDPDTKFETSAAAFQPRATARERTATALHYAWNTSAPDHLARMYLSEGAPRSVILDTSYTLQVYLFGDGSNTLFRFAADDGTQGGASFHEVSWWIPVSWTGWRLVEWDLGDTEAFGEWLGNREFDHPNSIRYDSFQLSYSSGTSTDKGTIYLDDLRAVKRTTVTTLAGDPLRTPPDFALYPNFPNPFNPTTTITFDIPKAGDLSLDIYDVRGMHVYSVTRGKLNAGRHAVEVDGRELSTGIYLYVVRFNGRQQVRKMTLMK